MSRRRALVLVTMVIAIIVAGDALRAQTPQRAASAWTPPASSIKTVYIIPSSHYDFGFVDPPDAVRVRAARHLDRVLEIAEKDPSFRWTIESVWQVNEWLKRAKSPASVLPLDERRVQSLVSRINSGQIALSMAWGSMHTDFMGVEPLNRLVYGFSALHRNYGVKSDFAMMDDVPGHPISIPSVLAASGVKRALIGVNQGLAGGTALAPGKVPFYWEGQDGARVLTWISQSVRGGYPEGLADYFLDPFTKDPYTDKTEFEMFHPRKAGEPEKTPLEVMETGMTELLTRYAKAGYAYDSVLVMHVHDFLEPDNAANNLSRAVALWNNAHRTPQLRIATPPEFFEHMEKTYGDRLPVYRGEWSGLWSEAKTHSPRVSALARAGHDDIPIAETLWSAIAATRGVPAPVGNVASLLDWLFTYDEHSGAGNTGWPGLNTREGLEEQNRQYARDMTRMRDESTRLIDTGLRLLAEPAASADASANASEGSPSVGAVGDSSLHSASGAGAAVRANADARAAAAAALAPASGAAPAADARAFVIYNPSSWARTDIVEIDAPDADADQRASALPNASASVLSNAGARSGGDTGVDDARRVRAREHIVSIARDGAEIPFERLPDGRAMFIARDVPPLGFVTVFVRTAPGAGAPTLAPAASTPAASVASATVASANASAAAAAAPASASARAAQAATIETSRYRVALDPRTGDIASLVDLASGRELVNARGLLPFNHLQWIHGGDPSSLALPEPPRVTVLRGRLLQRIVIDRPRAAFARTTITLYQDLDRIDIRNEIDDARLPFAGGRESWHDAYYFAFPFALDAAALQVRFEGQRGFTRVPEDYLAGARTDAVTSQHALALSDPKSTVLLAHRQAFHFQFAGFLKVKPSPAGAPKELPAMFTGKWPLAEATVFSKAFRKGDQADTHDLGIVNLGTVEPGFTGPYVFDYAISASAGAFDAVRASRFGAETNVPLRTRYLDVPPASASASSAAQPRGGWSFMQVDQPNIQILTIKPRVPEPNTGMVTSVPLAPIASRKFIVRLQEVAGAKQTTVRLTTPLSITHASLLDLVEDRVLKDDLPREPLTVTLGPYEVATIAIELANGEPRVP